MKPECSNDESGVGAAVYHSDFACRAVAGRRRVIPSSLDIRHSSFIACRRKSFNLNRGPSRISGRAIALGMRTASMPSSKRMGQKDKENRADQVGKTAGRTR
jgi:hypothetical protein